MHNRHRLKPPSFEGPVGDFGKAALGHPWIVLQVHRGHCIALVHLAHCSHKAHECANAFALIAQGLKFGTEVEIGLAYPDPYKLLRAHSTPGDRREKSNLGCAREGLIRLSDALINRPTDEPMWTESLLPRPPARREQCAQISKRSHFGRQVKHFLLASKLLTQRSKVEEAKTHVGPCVAAQA